MALQSSSLSGVRSSRVYRVLVGQELGHQGFIGF